MSLTDWPRIISSSVVPVVIISACGLLCLAYYNRLAAVVLRLRAFQRERLHEQELAAQATDDAEIDRRRKVLGMLEAQTAGVIRRAHLLRRTILLLLLTICLLIGCCMSLGLSVICPQAVYASVPLFMLGLLSMLASTITAMREMARALDPVKLEAQHVMEITHEGD